MRFLDRPKKKPDQSAEPADAPESSLFREALREAACAARSALAETARGGDPAAAIAALERLEAASATGRPEDLLRLATAAPRSLPGAGRHAAEAECLCDARALSVFAAEVIATVPRATEAATFAIIERFEAVHSKTSEAAAAARGARTLFATEGADSSLLSTAKASREAVRSERLAVGEIAASNRASSKALRGICASIEGGIELINGIEDITERSRLIAFNLAVEAAHFGEKGRGFKIIASELRALNDRTEEFSGKVTKLLGQLGEKSETLVRDMAEGAERMVSEAERGMGATEQAVESLILASENIERFARDIGSLAERIDADMNGVLESLQFQDITRQIVEGATATIRELPPILAAALGALPSGSLASAAEQARVEAIRARLLASSKTKDEKEALARARL